MCSVSTPVTILFRRRVRFCNSGEFQIDDKTLYPLDQELMKKMSGIQLDSKDRNENTTSHVSVEKLINTVNEMAIIENTCNNV